MDAGGLPARILDELPHGVLLLDERGAILYANRRARELTGYDERQLRGRNADLLVPRPERGDAGSWFGPGGGDGADDERHLLARDGQRIPVVLDRGSIAGEGGSTYLLCTLRPDGGSSDATELQADVDSAPTPWCATKELFRDRTRRALALARRRRLRVGILVARDTAPHVIPGLRAALRESDAAADLGDGELAVMLGELETREAVRKALGRLERRLGASGTGTTRIGVAVAPKDGVHVGELVEAARRDVEKGNRAD